MTEYYYKEIAPIREDFQALLNRQRADISALELR
jgi:hypothetical protein